MSMNIVSWMAGGGNDWFKCDDSGLYKINYRRASDR